jgi:hypothetical protein
MLNAHIGVGRTSVKYKELSNSTDGAYLFLDSGLSIILGVLTTWGVEIGIDLHLNQEKDILINDLTYKPAGIDFLGKFGFVYHHEII